MAWDLLIYFQEVLTTCTWYTAVHHECMSCHKATVVVTGRTHRFHDNIDIHVCMYVCMYSICTCNAKHITKTGQYSRNNYWRTNYRLKAVNYFYKTHHLRYLLGFWMHHWITRFQENSGTFRTLPEFWQHF